MLHLPSDDDDLTSLVGAIVPSELIAGVSYGVERALGGGAMSMAFLALRMAPEGQTRVVLKILRPAMARDSLGRAALVVRKEAVSFGRLNERVPPTPFVVRLADRHRHRLHLLGGNTRPCARLGPRATVVRPEERPRPRPR